MVVTFLVLIQVTHFERVKVFYRAGGGSRNLIFWVEARYNKPLYDTRILIDPLQGIEPC